MATKTQKIAKKSAALQAAKPAVKKSAKPAPAKKQAAPAKKPTASGAAALPGRFEHPLASYSPYAQHRILLEKFGTDEAGQAKVLAHGVKVLGLPETQVKTYIREKLAAILRDEQKKLGLHPSKPQLEKVKGAKAKDLDIDFRFPSREAAAKRIAGLVKSNGMHSSAFHILSEGGKFAVVPAHIRPSNAPPTFKKGGIAMDTTIADSRAEVIEAGPEQSTIRYAADIKYRQKEPTVPNHYLHLITAKSEKKAAPAPAKKKTLADRSRLNTPEARVAEAKAKKAAKKAK